MTIKTLMTLGTALLFLAGCGGEKPGPFDADVSNETDVFHFVASDLRNVTQTPIYLWNNTGTTANVTITVTRSAGSAILTILDAQGAKVFEKDIVTSGTFPTTAGTPGEWTIHMLIQEFDGALTIGVQKP